MASQRVEFQQSKFKADGHMSCWEVDWLIVDIILRKLVGVTYKTLKPNSQCVCGKCVFLLYAFDNSGDTQKHLVMLLIMKWHDRWRRQNNTEDDKLKTERFSLSHRPAERNGMHERRGREMDESRENRKTYEGENEATCGTITKRNKVARWDQDEEFKVYGLPNTGTIA